MRHVTPNVYLIGKSCPHNAGIALWLNAIGADEAAEKVYRTDRIYNDNLTPAETLVSLAGKRCYMSFQVGLNPNITRIRTDMSDFIENILKIGHGSVLEHVVYNFAIENVSRVFTGEMNRHRAGMAISEGSMRYIRFSDIPYWVPSSIQGNSDVDDLKMYEKKRKTRELFDSVFQNVEIWYAQLQEIWADELSPESKFHAKKQITSMMRRIIPMGIATGGVWSGNLRALRHIFTMRCAPEAEEEIMLVASMMLEKMIEVEPSVFKDFEKDENGYWRAKYIKV